MIFTNRSQNDMEEISNTVCRLWQQKGNPMGNGPKKMSKCSLTYELGEGKISKRDRL